MSPLFFATLGLGAAASAGRLPRERDLAVYSFNDYVTEFGKAHRSEEMASRERAFSTNLAAIRAHNADKSKRYFLTVNAFTDESTEEFGARRLRASPILSSSHVLGTHEVHAGRSYPTSLDWRARDGILSPVKNQGSCGSCWAFAAAATLESHYAISSGEAAPVLSPQELVSCSSNPSHCGGVGGCEGSTSELAFKYTVEQGLSAEMDYRYEAQTSSCSSAKLKPCIKNSGYIRVEDNSYDAHMDALQLGPLAIMLAANSMQSYGGGILTEGDCDLNHAVQLVGYGSDNNMDYWLVRNSWGSAWGEDGYVRIQRFGAGKEPTCVDETPQNGEACEGDDAPRTYTGLLGLLGATVYPTGVQGTGTECTAFDSTCPFTDPANLDDIKAWCPGLTSGCSFEGKEAYGPFDCTCFGTAAECHGVKPKPALAVV